MAADNRVTDRVKFPSKVATVNIFRGTDGIFAPVLGPLMQRRWIIALLSTAVGAMVALTAMGITTWQCPLRSALGMPCPGCGLTRAMVLFLNFITRVCPRRSGDRHVAGSRQHFAAKAATKDDCSRHRF